jgi:hypothetical protein
MSFTTHLISFIFGGISSLAAAVFIVYFVILKKIGKSEQLYSAKLHEQSANEVTTPFLDSVGYSDHDQPKKSESNNELNITASTDHPSSKSSTREENKTSKDIRERSKTIDPIQKVTTIQYTLSI